MVESYAVEATLDWKSNVPEVIAQMVAGFDRVNRLISDTKDSLGGLSSELRGLSGKGVASLVRSLEKLRVPAEALDGLKGMTEATRGLVELQADLARETGATARAYREMAEAASKMRVPQPPGQGGGGGRGHGSHTSAMDYAMAGQMAGDAGMNLLEKGYHAYADVQLQSTMAQSDKRVTDAVMTRANAVIKTLQKQYPALTQSEGLLLFRNSMGIFGDADESLKALPGAARLQQLYQLAPIGKGGTGGSEVQAAEKAGDAMQAFIDPKTQKLDVGLYQMWMDFQARSYQAGGGLIDAKSWLAFARTSRSAGIGLSGRALEEAQALLEMSPGRTGTAMMSAFQVFGASTAHMTNKNRAEWGKAGLLGKDGNIIDRALYQTDPFQWVWKDMVPALAKHGIVTRDAILRWLTTNGQRGTVSGILADIAIGQTPITNTATKMEAQDPNLVDKLVNTDTGKLAALHAAETNFFVALGKFGEGPGLKLLDNLTTALNRMTDWANAHPETATRLIEVGGGLALMSKVAGDAAMAAIFVGGPMVKGIASLARVLSPFAAGGAAETALATLASSGAGSLGAFGLALTAFAATLAGLAWLTKTPDGMRFVGGAHGGSHGGGHWEKQAPDGSWMPTTPPKSSLEQGWDNFTRGPSAAPGANSRRGSLATPDGTAVHRSAYVMGDGAYMQPQPIVLPITVQLDGKTIYQSVTRRMLNGMSSQTGPTAGDARAVPTPPGATAQT